MTVSDAMIEAAKAVRLPELIGAHFADLTGGHKEKFGPCPVCGGDDRFHVHLQLNRWFCSHCTGRTWQDAIEYVRQVLRPHYEFTEAVRELIDDPSHYEGVSHNQPKYEPRETIKPWEEEWAVPWWSTPEIQKACFTNYLNEHRFDAWKLYKPIPDEAIRAAGLGYGKLPPAVDPREARDSTGKPYYSGRCDHPRLIVPIIEGGRVVNWLGRAVVCDCTKWLPAKGGKTTLYGINEHRDSTNDVAWIIENKADAAWMRHVCPNFDIYAATSGVSVWWEPWTQILAERGYEIVIVAMDNGLAGNGGGTFREQLLAERHAKFADREHKPADPIAYGPKLAETLTRAGVNAHLFEWPEQLGPGADMGDLLTAMQQGELAEWEF